MEKKKAPLQLKKSLWFLIALTAVAGVFWTGYRLGECSRLRRELAIMIPAYTDMYESLKAGETNHVSSVLGMFLLSKMDRYYQSKKDFFFRLVGGGKLFSSGDKQQVLNQAQIICEEVRTNLVWVSPSAAK